MLINITVIIVKRFIIHCEMLVTGSIVGTNRVPIRLVFTTQTNNTSLGINKAAYCARLNQIDRKLFKTILHASMYIVNEF